MEAREPFQHLDYLEAPAQSGPWLDEDCGLGSVNRILSPRWFPHRRYGWLRLLGQRDGHRGLADRWLD